MAKANRVYPQKAPVTKNQEVEGEVVDITYQGMGVVKIDNFPIFVVDAIPGEIVRPHHGKCKRILPLVV